ncbi:MAG: MBL fold metallo-hydrolase [Candidatus Thorarchaeota archaeon]|nr:MBL fold metallo-hydrolase [Candidatus Thorarchaeota archaeon]
MSIVIKWLGHAGFQITGLGQVIYIDYYRPKKLEERLPAPTEAASVVLCTHSHGDHCDLDAIKTVLSKRTKMMAPASCREKLGKEMVQVRAGEPQDSGQVRIMPVEAYNVKRFRTPGNPYHPKGFGVGYVISLEGKTVYHAGDTDLIPEMSELGKVDVALLPVGDTYTMDIQEGLQAVGIVKPRYAIPMHTWDKDVSDFEKGLASSTVTRPVILKEGQEFSLS